MSASGDTELDSIRVYSRPGCHLCEKLVEEMLPLVHGLLRVEVVDIDTNADWKQKFDVRIPVVEYRGQTVCQYALDIESIREILAKLPGS